MLLLVPITSSIIGEWDTGDSIIKENVVWSLSIDVRSFAQLDSSATSIKFLKKMMKKENLRSKLLVNSWIIGYITQLNY